MKRLLILSLLLAFAVPAQAQQQGKIISGSMLHNYALCAGYLSVLSDFYKSRDLKDKASVAYHQSGLWREAGIKFEAANPPTAPDEIKKRELNNKLGMTEMSISMDLSIMEAKEIVKTSTDPAGVIKSQYDQYCAPYISKRDALLNLGR